MAFLLQRTALKIAVSHDNRVIAKLLLKRGAKVDATSDDVSASTLLTDYYILLQKTPLDIAKSRGKQDMIQLLEYYIDINSKLHQAVRDNDTQHIKELIEDGADVNSLDDKVCIMAVQQETAKGQFSCHYSHMLCEIISKNLDLSNVIIVLSANQNSHEHVFLILEIGIHALNLYLTCILYEIRKVHTCVHVAANCPDS